MVGKRKNSKEFLARGSELEHSCIKQKSYLVCSNMTPEEAWSRRKPIVDHFRIFCCINYAHVPAEKRKKLDDKDEKCVFLGISEAFKAYKLLNPLTKKILTSRDVIFDEDSTWNWNG